MGELVDADAQILSADAFGILADGLGAETARIVASQLARAGVKVDVVEQDRIPDLPGMYGLHRCECWANVFMATDSLGRDVPLDWSRVLLVSAGVVPLREMKREVRTRYKVRYVGGTGMGLKMPIAYVVPEKDVTIRYRTESRGLLDILVQDEPFRYHIRAEKFNYNYLGERQSNDEMENFVQLVGDLASYASGAALNRGTVAIRDEGMEAAFSYPSKHAFDEETRWLLSKFGQHRGRAWPWMKL